MDYLALVNRAILEAGVELDELSSSDFATPPTSLQKRFKNFVADAWKEIQMERNQWEFQMKRIQTTIRPRVKVVDGDRATAPPVDSIYEGDNTNATFTVKAVDLLSGAWADGDAVAVLDLDDLSTTGITFGETYDEVEPDELNVNVFKPFWYGEYDLIEDSTDVFEINKSSFYLQEMNQPTNHRLIWLDWEKFQTATDGTSGYFGQPQYVTETQDGTFDFYPRPAKQYTLTFSVTVTPKVLVDYDDVPEIELQYHDAIVWRAVMNYADYDDKPFVFSRAERRYKYYKNRLEVNKMPEPKWSTNRYDAIEF